MTAATACSADAAPRVHAARPGPLPFSNNVHVAVMSPAWSRNTELKHGPFVSNEAHVGENRSRFGARFQLKLKTVDYSFESSVVVNVS